MRFLFRLFGFTAMLGALVASCSKDLSVDPDLTKTDSSAVAQLSFKAGTDIIVTGTQVGVFSNISDTTPGYIALPVTVTGSGMYHVSTVAYFGGDSMVFTGKGYVTTQDSIVKIYPVNLKKILAGTYTVDSIKGNHIKLNDTTTKYYFDITVVVTDGPVTPSNPVVLPTDSSWSFTLSLNGKETVINGIFDLMHQVTGPDGQQQGVYQFNGDAQGGEAFFNLDISFRMPADLSKLPITVPTTGINDYASIGVSDGNKDSYLAIITLAGTTATVTISQYNASTKTIGGTFSGTLKNVKSSAFNTLSNGTFKAKLP